MNILIIEDNHLKREKVRDFINLNFNITLLEASSYNSGLNTAIDRAVDFIILDMSMPTFDRTETTHGGRFRTIAGKEIAIKLSRLNRLVPFVVLTGYKDFSVDAQNLNIEQIDGMLKDLGEPYLGCIVFDNADSIWKDKLSEIIKGIM